MTAVDVPPPAFGRMARWRSKPIECQALQASAILGGVGLAALLAMYASFGLGVRGPALAFGWVNDVLAVVTCPLALPAILRLHVLLAERSSVDRRALAALEAVGIASIVAISVLQALLVAGAMPFETEVRLIIPAFLAMAAWFIASGRLASVAGIIPRGGRLGLLAAAYVGYPLWAWRLAERLALEPGRRLSARPAATTWG